MVHNALDLKLICDICNIETVKFKLIEFINSLRLYRTFYGGLADQLCANELAAGDGLPCWNGEDIVK
ncbi:hypothetical protein J1605_005839, partial [Eschrichtius robustus]